MLEMLCYECNEPCWADADGVILGRRSPEGGGTLAYTCLRCGTPQGLFLDEDAVVFAMLAGATLVEEQSFRYDGWD